MEYSGIINLPCGTVMRLDNYIACHLQLISRSQLKSRIESIALNNKKVKLSCSVKNGDTINCVWKDFQPTILIPENINLNILYEDEHVIVINKKQGMVVHPGAGNWNNTLANALLGRRCKNQKNFIKENNRPFIVHRLDKDTSGVIIAAWDNEALLFLQEQFKQRTVKKTYCAIVKGCPKEQTGIIEGRICRDPHNRKRFILSKENGKLSKSIYRVINYFMLPDGRKAAFLKLFPYTGRTHQLRVHCKSINCPILGDNIYNSQKENFTLMLHARSLAITLPGKNKYSVFKAPLPVRFKNILNNN